ncbi:hypothetical protein AVEN_126316-1 [Araneus ventricosus]|uniref:Uncharacterized protein n=1 Tax=Araneus ventricosus TaxID=182803 RepID=A0A4Y2FDJ9_ARAVE|nr:hypothetical protein AVEN_126316-1 [Araneus ventricosus]
MKAGPEKIPGQLFFFSCVSGDAPGSLGLAFYGNVMARETQEGSFDFRFMASSASFVLRPSFSGQVVGNEFLLHPPYNPNLDPSDYPRFWWMAWADKISATGPEFPASKLDSSDDNPACMRTWHTLYPTSTVKPR